MAITHIFALGITFSESSSDTWIPGNHGSVNLFFLKFTSKEGVTNNNFKNINGLKIRMDAPNALTRRDKNYTHYRWEAEGPGRM